ncbi:uncharacterized protein LOC125278672 [Megalobrama amblycephala]|uniref:uncharacterized protein LOC125278672 n=1 Tax=Megalobrama amblycephala TaxID=75352 RepID=UPI0020146632|nr:uncharacterized protein LOC125278672 [Megalobrama amblycephala]
MEHFGLQDVAEIPDGFVPVDVNDGLPQLKRSWLHDKVGQVVDTFVMLTDITEAASQRQASTEPRQRQQFPCRADGCGNVYTYVKARETHEQKKHNIVAPSESSPENASPTNQDHKKKHTEARLGFGFFLLNMQDAVREGDGERLMRLYKVALLFYKAYGHSHYAYSTFLLTLQVNVTLSPRMAHSVIWNRFWNGTGGKGKNISLDLHLEHLNNFLKSFIKGLGPNLSEMSADRISKSIGILKELMDKTDTELELSRPTGLHHVAREQEDVLTLVNVLRQAQLFQHQPGRQFHAFPNFRKNLLVKLKYRELWQWMKSKLMEWRDVSI